MNRKQRRIHRILAGLFLLLLISGVLQACSSLQGSISGYRYVLVNIHMLAGLIFGITFATNGPFFWTYRAGLDDGLHRREYLWLIGIVCSLWVLSGLGLLGVLVLGYVGPTANTIHDIHILVATIGALTILPHFVFGMVRIWRNRKSIRPN